MKKYVILLISILPISLFAETSTEIDSMVTQMKSVLDQYAAKIKALEVENNILRNEIMKAGIKIPLSTYTGTIVSTGTTTKTGSTSNPTNTTYSNTLAPNVSAITSTYGTRYANFVTKIHTDWSAIRTAYKMPETAFIGGYEFVKQGSDNHVFVDIIYDTATNTGTYDAKILYEYNTETFQRKLIGFFEFNKATGYYVTKTGNNPFAGVARIFVQDPDATKRIVPPTATAGTGNTTPPIGTNVTTTLAEIEKAYNDKRYLSVISLSNNYLSANTPTYDLLRIRYRTYFIIGKYSESLAEISKIEAMGRVSTVACDAQVIATYSKNQTLIDKYTKLCAAK